MKKIISGKLYNTDTAKELGYDGGGDGFSRWTESLYRKKSGEFFLHGSGGPMSRYAESAGQNEWTGGEKIIPLAYDAARQWAEEHLRVEEYEEIFGAIEEDDTTVQMSLRLSASTAATIRRRAAEAGVGIAAWIEQLVRESAR